MAEAQINFRFAGRRVPLERVGNVNLQAVLGNAARDARRKVAEMNCPNHEGMVIIEISGQSATQLRYDVHSCCAEFAEQVTQALG